MATSTSIPVSNAAGNNGSTSGGTGITAASTMPSAAVSAPAVNPYIAPATTTGATAAIPSALPGGASGAALNKQLTDIYGAGVGGALASELGSMSGPNSATLQEYQQSLIPQEATAQANLNASLGAGGVSANSSVAALGGANLQAQETAAIAEESAKLTEHQEDLTAQILGGMEGAAAQETASSGWDTFGQVIGAVGSDAGGIMKGLGELGVSL